MTTNVDRFFQHEHLPPKLKEVSKPFTELQQLLDRLVPDGPEKSTGARKLLEAKDCYVRAALES